MIRSGGQNNSIQASKPRQAISYENRGFLLTGEALFISSVEHIKRQQRDFQARIDPFVHLLIKIQNCTMPTMILHPDGHMDIRYDYTDEQQGMIKQINENIEYITSVYSRGAV